MARITLKWPSKSSLIGFARHSLRVAPEKEDSWYLKARWGFYASRIIGKFALMQRRNEILSLLEEPIDWSPVKNCLIEGRGAIVAGAHLGLGYVPGIALKSTGFYSVAIAATRLREGNIFVDTENDLKLCLVRAMKHLRLNHIVLAAPTGRFGNRSIKGRFLGQEIPIPLGIGELARLTGAQTFWPHCTWTGLDRIKLSFEPMLKPTAEGDAWLEQWYNGYFERLERQMKECPADLGFRDGFWIPDEGGLNWYKATITESVISFFKEMIFERQPFRISGA